VAECLVNPQAAQNKVLEVVAETDAPVLTYAELLATIEADCTLVSSLLRCSLLVGAPIAAGSSALRPPAGCVVLRTAPFPPISDDMTCPWWVWPAGGAAGRQAG